MLVDDELVAADVICTLVSVETTDVVVTACVDVFNEIVDVLLVLQLTDAVVIDGSRDHE